MSRVGNAPIAVPEGLSVEVSSGTVKVSGSQGELSQAIPEGIEIEVQDSVITVSRSDDTRQQRSLHGLARALVNNMVEGVANGYMKELNIVGVGWNAKLQGKGIQLNVGYCHPVDLTPPDGVKVEIENNNRITLSGPDKHAVGQFAAVIRDKRRPEPYNGKGILYEGEVIIRKQGKVFGA